MTGFEEQCEFCKFFDHDVDEFPCTDCKHNIPSTDEAYTTTPSLWQFMYGNPVEHPYHYNQGGIECLDAMMAAYGKEATATFCLTNAFKYIWRTEHKNGLQDIDKAIWYLNKYKELKSSE